MINPSIKQSLIIPKVYQLKTLINPHIIKFFHKKSQMHYNILPSASRQTPEPLTPSQTSFCFPDENADRNVKLTCFQYVNPSLLLEWEGDVKKANQICGAGVFRAYERSKDGNHKSKLVLSLEADKWKDGKPYGEVKMVQVFFYDSTRKDNIVKEVRKFNGKMENMLKQGYGEYTIQHFYSNETKETIEIKGVWSKDFLASGTVFKNGKMRENIKFSQNVEIGIAGKQDGPTLQSINFVIKEKKSCSRIILNPILASNKCLVTDYEKKDNQEQKDQKPKSGKNVAINLLAPPQPKLKPHQKNLR